MLRYIFALMIFAVAAAATATFAPRLATLAGARYAAQVDAVLEAGGHSWAQSDVDGLTVTLTGPAPSVIAQANVLGIVGAISPALTITDAITRAPKVAPTVIPPHLEILKGVDTLILTGVIEHAVMVEALESDAAMLTFGATSFEVEWAPTRPILQQIAASLRHARITVEEDAITIVGLAGTQTARAALTPSLERLSGIGWRVETSIDAPPPSLKDFELLADVSPDVQSSLSCAASSATDAATIQRAAAVTLGADARCAIGAGAPDEAWATAAEAGLTAIADLPAVRLHMIGKSVTLTLSSPTSPDAVSKVRDRLTTGLPAGYQLVVDNQTIDGTGATNTPFSLTVDWPGGDAPLTITSAQSGGGLQRASRSLDAYVRALFPGADATFATEDGPSPPTGWRRATRTGLKALSRLSRGAVTVAQASLTLTGTAAHTEEIRAAHDALATAGTGWQVTTRISYDPTPLAAAQPLSPGRCAAEVASAITDTPLSFQPASTTLTSSGMAAIDRIAQTLGRCEGARFEIGGHTDAQGSEAGNLALSRNRAEAVLTALIVAKAPPGRLTAKGYGEALPVASNDTAAGRALNRRIEFTLIEAPK